MSLFDIQREQERTQMEQAQRKADALSRAFLAGDPYLMLGRLSVLIASLTSTNKHSRDWAKAQVRDLVKIGTQIEADQEQARRLEEFANRSEPGQVAP